MYNQTVNCNQQCTLLQWINNLYRITCDYDVYICTRTHYTGHRGPDTFSDGMLNNKYKAVYTIINTLPPKM